MAVEMSRKKKKRKEQKLTLGKKRLIETNIPLNIFPSNVDSELRKAAIYHQSGQLKEAAKIYRRILKRQPNHSESLYRLGVVNHQFGKNDIAVTFIKKAIQNDPRNPIYYNNLGIALEHLGELSEAVSYYQKALQLKPDLAEAFSNMGNAFQRQSRFNEAISCYQKAVQLKPSYARAYNNMGNAFQHQSRFNEAISCYQKALQLKPDLAAAYNNMGNTLKGQGKSDEAIASYRKAIQLEPYYAEPYNNMGTAFENQGKSDEATASYRKAIQLEPHYAEPYNNMGNVFQRQGNLNEALSCYMKALQLKPDLAEAYYNMANVFKNQGNSGEAVTYYQKALAINPDYAEVYCQLVDQLQQTCAWNRLEDLTAKLDDMTTKALDEGEKAPEQPFLSLTRHADLQRNFSVAKSWSSDISRLASNMKIHFSFDDRSSAKGKITVGYLSSNFYDHPTAHLMLGLFGLHNRNEFEIFCYSYGKDDRSYYRERIRRDCDKFVDLRNFGHADAAKSIYDDGVDILVDLMGHTRDNRLEACALRAAPIQVRYLDFPGTSGADFFDYLITDRIVSPEDHASYYSENFVYLPHCYLVNDHTQAISNKETKRADFGLPEGSFVFCSFNAPYKIERLMFDIWMRILRQIPEGVLWLWRKNRVAEKNLRHEAEARGVNPDRLVFAKHLPRDEHLARLRHADLALDTRIVNGHTTTTDALWTGVPVITLEGTHFISRVSASLLTAIGLSELITHNIEDYETLAVQLARNPGELRAVKQKLEKNRLTEPLFNTPQFVKNLEKAYKEMWRIFLARKKPRQINIEDIGP